MRGRVVFFLIAHFSIGLLIEMFCTLLGSFSRENEKRVRKGGGKFSFQNPVFGLIRFEEEAYDVNVGRIDSDAGVDAYVFAGPVSGPDFQSEVVTSSLR